MKRDQKAASGRCLIPVQFSSHDSQDILRENKITTVGAKLQEIQALSRGLMQIKALYGRVPSFVTNVEFTFEQRTGYSSYRGWKRGRHIIKMNRCDSKGRGCAPNNVAHLMHELGHRVGHTPFQRGENFYNAYTRLVGNCHPTRYSRHNRNEQFAEVFAAYLTHPERLRNGNSSCQRAYMFFARDVFVQNGEWAGCDQQNHEYLMAQVGTASASRYAQTQEQTQPKTRRSRHTQTAQLFFTTYGQEDEREEYDQGPTDNLGYFWQ